MSLINQFEINLTEKWTNKMKYVYKRNFPKIIRNGGIGCCGNGGGDVDGGGDGASGGGASCGG